MFKRIYYDYKRNKIFHWFTDEDGKTRREEFHPDIEYYIKDKSGKSQIKDIYGNPVILQKTNNRFNLKNVTENMQTYEANLSEEIKFLQKRYGNQDLKVNIKDFQIATIDIEVASIDGKFPKPKFAKSPINLISVHLSKQNQIYTFGLQEYTGDSDLVKNYRWFKSEIDLIRSFILFFRKCKVDIITGWNITGKFGFDIPYIINRCRNLGIEESLSPIGEYREKSNHAGYHIDGGGYEILGLNILDGLDLYKNFEREKRQSYSLNAIGLIELNEGKLDFEGSLNDLWKNDWNKFVEYNIQDVLLTKKINDKKRYIELTINFCYQALVPFEKIYSTINIATGFIARYLHKQNMVLPDKSKTDKGEKFDGAFVVSNPGLHEYCMNYDIESLYPNCIISWNISPETLVLNPDNVNDPNLIKSALDGVFYRKDKIGVIPQVVSKIFSERKSLKYKRDICYYLEKGITDPKEISEKTEDHLPVDQITTYIKEIEAERGNESYYDSNQYIRKILINAIFGDLGNPHFVFYDLYNAKAITGGGQAIIKFLSNSINKHFKENINDILKEAFPETEYPKIQLKNDIVILIDTDSNYLSFKEIHRQLRTNFKDNKEFKDWCYAINDKILEPFYDRILKDFFKQYNIDKIVNFRKEKIITEMIILAKKKYVMKVIDKEGKYFETPKLSFTGIETVRTDTPVFCRRYIKNLVDELFDTKNKDKVIDMMINIYEKYLKANVADIAIAKGVKDYTKWSQDISYYLEAGLRYIKGTPVHVRASINYNYMIEKFNLPLIPIDDGTKMKFVYVKPKKNMLHQNVIGFVGNWPEEFNKYFEIDMDRMWDKTIKATIERFFSVIGWGNANLEKMLWDEF